MIFGHASLAITSGLKIILILTHEINPKNLLQSFQRKSSPIELRKNKHIKIGLRAENNSNTIIQMARRVL